MTTTATATQGKGIVYNASGVEFKIYPATKGGKPAFLLADYSTGKRRLLNHSNLAAAQARADAIRQAMVKGAASRTALSEAEWQQCVLALDLLRPLKVSLLDAVKGYLTRQDGAPKPTKMTVQAAHDGLLASMGSLSAKHRRNTECCLRRFVEAHGGQDVSEFNPATLERWLSSRTQNPKTFNEYRNAFNALFGFAVKSSALKANPVADIKRRRLERRDVEIYSPAEAQKLLAAAQQAGPEMLVYISLAAFAGVRPHEIAGTEEHPGLDWKDIGATSIKVPANVAKNKRSRTIALQPNLAALLAPHRQTSGAVCPGLLPQEVSLQLSTAAGVRWIHDGLRHSFSSYRAVQAGHLVACKENGDTLQVFDRHYLTREPVSQEQAEAYFALGLPAANTVQFPVANAG